MDSPSGTRFDPPGAASILSLPNYNGGVDPTGRNALGFRRNRRYQRGSIALRVPTSLTPGAEATVQFTLPDTQLPIRAEVKVCWYNEECQAGLSFLALSPHASSELQGWIACRFEV